MVAVLASCYGLVNAVDNPTRQSFVVEMVGASNVRNAVTLYSSLVNLSRVIGPAIAGVIIVVFELAPCFIINGLSYVAVVVMLLMMRTNELNPAPPIARASGQLRDGLRYILATPVLRNVLLMMALIGTLTFEFQVSLPLIAQMTFRGNAESYAALTGAMGLGAVLGGLITAGQKNISLSLLIAGAFLFGVTTLIASAMPTLLLSVVALALVGIFSILFTSLGNSILQLESEPQMRGRVMAFWSIAFLGSTAIGGPIIGWIGEQEPRWGLAVGGLAAIVAAVLGAVTLNGPRPRSRPA
ncbi:MAG: MFS transporter, partial [Chloroflexi bacterium]|nr:MFS transporter [Chloroflexota bacterium]